MFRKVIVFIISIFYINLLFSQVLRTPKEVIDIQRILRLKQLYNNQSFSAEEVLPILDKEIQNYFKQFRDERILRDQIISIPYDYYNFPLNKLHQLIYIRNISDLQKTNRIYSPYLFEALLFKAQLYQSMNQPKNALSNYIQSINYTIPIIDQPYLINDNIVNLLSENIDIIDLEKVLNQNSFKDRLNYFEYWNSTIGNNEYKNELLNESLKINIEKFQKLYDNFIKSINEIQQIKKEYYKLDLNFNENTAFINEKQRKYKEFMNKWKEIHTSWKELLNIEKEFINYQKELKKRYSEILFNMANLMKDIEQKNKEQERLLNQSSYYRGTGNSLGVNKTLYRDFVGYKVLLEMAYNLDPENMDYLDMLSDLYFTEKNTLVGLQIEKKWLQLAKEDDKRTPKHYFRIISYYLNSKNISLAKKYLDELYQYLKDNKEMRRYIFLNEKNEKFVLEPFEHFLIFYYDFYLENYPSLEKNSELNDVFGELLKKIDLKLNNTKDISNKVQAIKLKYKILYNLAKYERLNKDFQKELENLMELYKLEQFLKEQITDLEKEKNLMEKEILQLKETLYYEENNELSQKLFQLEKVDYPNLINQIYDIYLLKNSFQIDKILERIAYLNFLNKDYQTSILFYNKILNNEAININVKKRAMKNIQTLNKILETGYNLKIELPDTFER